MADKTNTEELRNQYRADRARAGYGKDAEWHKAFVTECVLWLHKREYFNTLGKDLDESKFTPEQWARAAKGLADDETAALEEGQRRSDEFTANGCEPDDEGFMGTGMSEAAYFTAAGSAEFL
jgi:hypothetical protein